MSNKTVKLALSAVFLAAGIFMFSPYQKITGSFIGSLSSGSITNSFLGIVFLIASVLLVAAHSNLEKITLTSAIKKSSALLKLTKDAVENQKVQKELDHLVKELTKGNFEAGLGKPGHIKGTDISYLRGRNGARLYYHKTGKKHYEIVAKSSKGRNQNQIISKIRELYGK